MEPAVVGALAALISSIILQGLNWLLSRSGRTLAGKRDLREDIDQLTKRVEAQDKEIEGLKTKNDWWEDKYKQLEIDSAEQMRQLNMGWERRYRILETKCDNLKNELESYKKNGSNR